MNIQFHKKVSLSEVGDTTLEYNILTKHGDKFTGVAPGFVCKDFMTDFVAYYLGHKPSGDTIYGFEARKYASDSKRSRIYLFIRDRVKYHSNEYKDLSHIDGPYQDFINHFDTIFGFELSEMWYSDEHRGFLIEYDNEWHNYPYMVSLLTLLLRVGIVYEPSKNKTPLDFLLGYNKNDKDALMIKQAKETIELLVSGNRFEGLGYNKFTSLGGIHNNCGIVAISPTIKDVKNGTNDKVLIVQPIIPKKKFVLEEDELIHKLAVPAPSELKNIYGLGLEDDEEEGTLINDDEDDE